MQSQFAQNQPIEVSSALLNATSIGAEKVEEASELAQNATSPMCFQTHFESCMELYADAKTVANYLDSHQGWFGECAEPMKVERLGDNAYALTIGSFGAFGYEVEPKIGLELLPAEAGVYRIQTVPIPNYVPPGYDVDYKSSMHLVEVTTDGVPMTRVEWQLEVAVYLRFPKFIYKLQKSLLQKTGDRILSQIVRQVSRRLTFKTQEDFHTALGIPFPPKKSKKR